MGTAIVTAVGTIIVAAITAGSTVYGIKSGRKHQVKMMELAEAASQKKVTMILFICGLIAALGLVIWSFYFIITQLIVSPKYEANTTVHYSAGVESEWAYAQQRKEYSLDKDCYLRIMTDVSASNLRGNNKEVEIKLIFTGTDICDITFFDGTAMEVQVGDNQMIFSYTLKTHKATSEEQGTVSIFKYHPNQEGDVSLKVEYGQRLDEEHDVINTISFVDDLINE